MLVFCFVLHTGVVGIIPKYHGVHWCKGDSYGCPSVTSRLTSPLIARLSNLQTVAGHIATAK
ncbi:hypothetical protein J6590_083523 [Homalodisca vitripennis]|nr:hypothetical protein J6590_083523 [Homalodisca vitripennis]